MQTQWNTHLARCALRDALVCILTVTQKSPPGMLMAAMRLNIPVIFVSATNGAGKEQNYPKTTTT